MVLNSHYPLSITGYMYMLFGINVQKLEEVYLEAQGNLQVDLLIWITGAI